MTAEVKDRTLCRHCPVAIVSKDGKWVDESGRESCGESASYGDGRLITHTPLPTGLRGGA